MTDIDKLYNLVRNIQTIGKENIEIDGRPVEIYKTNMGFIVRKSVPPCQKEDITVSTIEDELRAIEIYGRVIGLGTSKETFISEDGIHYLVNERQPQEVYNALAKLIKL